MLGRGRWFVCGGLVVGGFLVVVVGCLVGDVRLAVVSCWCVLHCVWWLGWIMVCDRRRWVMYGVAWWVICGGSVLWVIVSGRWLSMFGVGGWCVVVSVGLVVVCGG